MTVQTTSQDLVAQRKASIHKFAHLMDSKFAVPGTKITFGIDPIIGLFPVLGSVAGLLISTGIIVQGVRYGARGWTLTLMLINLALDATIGSIPGIGTLFDVFYKANTRNVALLENHVEDPYQTSAGVRKALLWAFFCIAVFTAILIIAVIAGTIWLLTWLF